MSLQVFEQEWQVASPGAFFGTPSFPEKAVAATRRKFAIAAVKPLLKETDALVSKLLDSTTHEEFMAQRKVVFQAYAKIVQAISNVIYSVIPSMDHGLEIAQKSLSDIAEKFESNGTKKFGQTTKEEILFLMSTVKRANALAMAISKKKPPESHKERDVELWHNYMSYVLWAQLHMDCLGAALNRRKHLDKSILSEILAGFRICIMAYSCAREALELRGFLEKNCAGKDEISWDEEDEALANF